MKTFAINDTNGFLRGPSGDFVLLDGRDAIRDAAKTAILVIRNEMRYAMDQGMPTFETAFNEYRPQQFEAAARARISVIPGVIRVSAFSIASDAGTLAYTATIQTVYGMVNING